MARKAEDVKKAGGGDSSTALRSARNDKGEALRSARNDKGGALRSAQNDKGGALRSARNDKGTNGKNVKTETKSKTERRQLTTAEWRKIRLEYVKGKTTYKALAEKWGISASYIRKKASNEGWRKKKNNLDAKVEQKALERICDARAREFEIIAKVNDDLGAVLDNMLDFVRQQPPKKYDDMRGVESLAKAINQVVQTKRDLYNIPGEVDRAKIEALREKNKLEREKWQREQEEKAAGRAAMENTMWKVQVPEGEEDALDG